jgi:hypothetical protein
MKADDDCIAHPCNHKATHVLTMKVMADGNFPKWETKNDYCLEHAIYFAGWLPYCYPGKYEVVSITPPASELFGR